MGKTALATNIAFNAARAAFDDIDERGIKPRVDGHVVGLFSLEMSAEQLALRILAEHSGVSYARVRRGQITNRSEEPTSELHSLLRTSYAVFCLTTTHHTTQT